MIKLWLIVISYLELRTLSAFREGEIVYFLLRQVAELYPAPFPLSPLKTYSAAMNSANREEKLLHVQFIHKKEPSFCGCFMVWSQKEWSSHLYQILRPYIGIGWYWFNYMNCFSILIYYYYLHLLTLMLASLCSHCYFDRYFWQPLTL